MELNQRRIWDRRHFKLLEDSVWLRQRSPTEDVELKVKYEELGLEVAYVRNKSASLVYGSLLFLSTITGRMVLKDTDLNDTSDIILLTVICAFVLILLLMAWMDSNKSLVIINGGEKNIALLRNSPDANTVDQFINELHSRIIDRIIKVRVRPHDPEFNYRYKKSSLDLLLEEKVIDDQKYNQILRQISENNQNRIGFANSLSEFEENEEDSDL